MRLRKGGGSDRAGWCRGGVGVAGVSHTAIAQTRRRTSTGVSRPTASHFQRRLTSHISRRLTSNGVSRLTSHGVSRPTASHLFEHFLRLESEQVGLVEGLCLIVGGDLLGGGERARGEPALLRHRAASERGGGSAGQARRWSAGAVQKATRLRLTVNRLSLMLMYSLRFFLCLSSPPTPPHPGSTENKKAWPTTRVL